jgi:hypothetical protein
MASSYSPLKVELIGTGEQAGSWGTTTNVNLGTTLEEAITGRATATFPSDANYTLPYIDSNASQVFRNLVLNVTSSGNLSATRDLIIPAIEKQYFVENNTSGSQSIRIKTAAGTGVTIPTGKVAHVYCDGTNTRFADDFVGITGGTIANVAITNSTITLSSPLAVTQGGTGLSTTSQGDILYSSASNTLVVLPKNTTASRYLSNTGTSNNPAWAQIDLTNGVVNTLPVTNGGTGLSTATQGDILYASGANTYVALPKSTTATRYLANTGTSNNPAWSQIDLTNGVINTLPVNRGGTGLATVTAGALLLGAGTSAFTTLTGTVTGQVVSWNNSTATWEVGTLASGVSSFSAGTTGFTPSTGTTGAVTLAGTLNVANGGTGQTSYTNGQLLIGNSTGNTLTKATLTQGNNISITNGSGSITIAQSVFGPNVQVFSSVGSGLTFTIPTGVTKLKVTVVGGGGGGGAFYNSGCSTFLGGGGGGGGAAIKWLSGLTPSNTLSVTVGAGGSGGSSGNTSSVASGTQSITTVSATGGAAGGAGFFGSGLGGAGGLGSNGDLNIGGSAGSPGAITNGTGGSSILGGGGVATSGSGSTGRPYGGGASGGGSFPSPDGVGAAGVVIFEW